MEKIKLREKRREKEKDQLINNLEGNGSEKGHRTEVLVTRYLAARALRFALNYISN